MLIEQFHLIGVCRLSGLSPFLGETEQETLSNVTSAKWDFNAEEFDNISSDAKDFITRLLVRLPKQRMSATDCLEHLWLRVSQACPTPRV